MKKHKMFSFLYILYLILVLFVKSSESSKVMCANENDLVDIDEEHQEAILIEETTKCYETQIKEIYTLNFNTTCATTWDEIVCWPSTVINQKIEISCPNYIDKFNMKKKARKYCFLNQTTGFAEWSLTNYTECQNPVDCSYRCDLEHHINYIVIIRICGYMASMLSLSLSIFILFRPKLRCPRNYVHINLFTAFAARTILVMLVDSIVNQKSPIMMFIFRYTGSVYHVAIFGEALYLVLLLKFPYYSEKKGSTFCIVLSWVLPLLWMIPWLLVRFLKENYWCWNQESSWNFIIKIPHSLLLVLNISCAVFIIRILYSKMRSRSMSREKLLKYRRLAKSILILIPIFGLHFIFFAWLPYAHLVHLDPGPCLEIIFTYIETFFNAFQGLVVSITSCFIHNEVRVEIILLCCELLKKIKCFRSLECLESDYIFQLRYSQSENRYQSINLSRTPMRFNSQLANTIARSNSENLSEERTHLQLEKIQQQQPQLQSKRKRTMSESNTPTRDLYNINSIEEEEEYQLVDPISSTSASSFKKKSNLANNNMKCSSQSDIRKSSLDTTLSVPIENKCCSFLFTNQQNDFFLSENRKSRINKSKKQKLKKINDQLNNNLTNETKKQKKQELIKENNNNDKNIFSENNQIKTGNSIDEPIT